MELRLKYLRKAAGYRSRDAFASVIGVNPRTYKTWESGERNMSFSQACMVADALGCSLDELAGRTEYVGTYSDQRQAELNDDYLSLTEAGKDAAAGAVRGIKLTEEVRAQEEHQELPKAKLLGKSTMRIDVSDVQPGETKKVAPYIENSSRGVVGSIALRDAAKEEEEQNGGTWSAIDKVS